MARKLFDRMSPAQAAAHLMRTRRGNPAIYARDREDLCRTETEAFYWIRVQEELDILVRKEVESRRKAAEAARTDEVAKVRSRPLNELDETVSIIGMEAKGYGVHIFPGEGGYVVRMHRLKEIGNGFRKVVVDSYDAALKKVLAYQTRHADLLHDGLWGLTVKECQ